MKVVDNAKTFTDTSGHWAADAIDFASSRELFNGTSATAFSPNEEMTRAMLVTVLRRMEDEAETAAENAFANIPDDTWYTDAVIWASENGIVNGVAGGTLRSRRQHYPGAAGGHDVPLRGLPGHGYRRIRQPEPLPRRQPGVPVGIRRHEVGGQERPHLREEPHNFGSQGQRHRAEVATILQRMTALMVK